jgi:hypothetical protein
MSLHLPGPLTSTSTDMWQATTLLARLKRFAHRLRSWRQQRAEPSLSVATRLIAHTARHQAMSYYKEARVHSVEAGADGSGEDLSP